MSLISVVVVIPALIIVLRGRRSRRTEQDDGQYVEQDKEQHREQEKEEDSD